MIRQDVPAAFPFACARAEDMLRRKRHRWIKDALIAIGVALMVVGAYELLTGTWELLGLVIAAP